MEERGRRRGEGGRGEEGREKEGRRKGEDEGKTRREGMQLLVIS